MTFHCAWMLERGLARIGDLRFISLSLEVELEDIREVLLVFDYQDAHAPPLCHACVSAV